MIVRDSLPLKQVHLVVIGTNWTTNRAVGVFYKTINSDYRMVFNIEGSIAGGATTSTLAVLGVTFKNVIGKEPAIYCNVQTAASYSKASVGVNANTIGFQCAVSGTQFNFAGDVELESKPTFLE